MQHIQPVAQKTYHYNRAMEEKVKGAWKRKSRRGKRRRREEEVWKDGRDETCGITKIKMISEEKHYQILSLCTFPFITLSICDPGSFTCSFQKQEPRF